MELNLKGKTALVTGGSRGLGKVICLSLAAEGANVVVNYFRDTEKGIDLVDEASEVVKEVESAHGVQALAIPANLPNEQEVLDMFAAAREKFGHVDILVNNAAYLPSGWITDYTKEEWDYTFEVNVSGAFTTCRELVRDLVENNRKGRIINIVSQAAFRGSTTGHLPYDSSKGALVTMTLALAREVSAKGINVTAVAPGLISTDMIAETLEKNKERYMANLPIKRYATPQEIANIVVFLASDAASYITGATIDASGGMMMR